MKIQSDQLAMAVQCIMISLLASSIICTAFIFCETVLITHAVAIMGPVYSHLTVKSLHFTETTFLKFQYFS